MYNLVKRSNFVLVKNLNDDRYSLLFCDEPKDEKKAFLQLEKVIVRHVTKRGNSN